MTWKRTARKVSASWIFGKEVKLEAERKKLEAARHEIHESQEWVGMTCHTWSWKESHAATSHKSEVLHKALDKDEETLVLNHHAL